MMKEVSEMQNVHEEKVAYEQLSFKRGERDLYAAIGITTSNTVNVNVRDGILCDLGNEVTIRPYKNGCSIHVVSDSQMTALAILLALSQGNFEYVSRDELRRLAPTEMVH